MAKILKIALKIFSTDFIFRQQKIFRSGWIQANMQQNTNLLKVSKFQNVFMKSSFLPNYESKKCKDFFPVVWHSTGQKSLHILVHIFGETMTS